MSHTQLFQALTTLRECAALTAGFFVALFVVLFLYDPRDLDDESDWNGV